MKKKFAFRELALKSIETDYEFQRPLNEPRAREMAESFKPELFGVPVISQRSPDRVAAGEVPLVALDGQHRIKASVLAKLTSAVPMKVFRNLTLQEEAELFLLLNAGQKLLRAFDKFKAKLVAKDPDALEIKEILKGFKLKVTKTKQRRGVCAIKALEIAHRHSNLEPTLYILTMWDDGSPESYEGDLIKAVSNFLLEYADVDHDETIKKLQRVTPEFVLRKIHSKLSMDMTPYEAAVFVLRNIYNERRPQRNQLPPIGQKKSDNGARKPARITPAKQLAAASVNNGHRTNADKREAVMALLRDAKYQHGSRSAIAQAAGVSPTLVARVEAELADA